MLEVDNITQSPSTYSTSNATIRVHECFRGWSLGLRDVKGLGARLQRLRCKLLRLCVGFRGGGQVT